MQSPMQSKFWLSALAALFPVLAVSGDIYRHVDENGVVHYSDKPVGKNAQPVTLPPIQVVSPVRSSDDGAEPVLSEAAAAAPGIRITAPAAEQTIRGDDRRVAVSVSLDQPLPQGYGLLYLLDGSAQNGGQPTRQLGFTLEGVERGEHLLAVAMVDAGGKEVGRSAPVIVHMKPPTVANYQRLHPNNANSHK